MKHKKPLDTSRVKRHPEGDPTMKNIVLLASVLALLAACNTIQGVGEDVKGAGEWTAESAQKVKRKIDE